jgi:hypothetical protein
MFIVYVFKHGTKDLRNSTGIVGGEAMKLNRSIDGGQLFITRKGRE